MQLFYREMGEGHPFVVLHGLFGMSDNWLTIGRRLAEHFHVYLLDLRNHGNSPHAEAFNYDVMCADLEEFVESHDLKEAVILGHSMGGKVAMNFALNKPQHVGRLIVVDIAPRAYQHQYFKMFLRLLMDLDLSQLKTRAEADRFLSTKIPQAAIRQFLLKNLKRNQNNQFEWKINLPALYANVDQILAGIQSQKTFNGPTLFLRGEFSDYIQDSDLPQIKALFPKAQIKTIKNATHWVHADAPEQMLKEILSFVQIRSE